MSNVRNFGAMGDGCNDDSDAIYHAIHKGDGVLYFPPGRYLISKTIELDLRTRGPVGIAGAVGTASLVMAGAGPALRLIGTHDGTGDPDTASDSVNRSERMPVVSDLEIVGTSPKADGIECVRTKQGLFRSLVIRNVRHGIYLVERNRNVLITHCHIYHNSGAGVFLDGVNLHQINIADSHISYNRLGGIRIERSEIRNLQITGNDIEYNNHASHGTDPEPTAEIYVDTTEPGSSVNEITIASNTIQATPSPEGSNIRIQNEVESGRKPGLWSITGNVIGNQQVNVHLAGCHGMVFSGNCIYSSEQQNMLIENSEQVLIGNNLFRRHTPSLGTGVRVENCSRINIHGCTFQDESETGQLSALPLLELIRSELVTITGCQLVDGVPEGVSVKDCSLVNIMGCTITDQRKVPLMQHAIAFRGQGKGNRVSGNIIAGSSRQPVWAESNVELSRE